MLFLPLGYLPFLLFTHQHTSAHPLHTLCCLYYFCPNLLCDRGRKIPAEYCDVPSSFSSWILFLVPSFFGLNNAFGFILTTKHIQTQNTQEVYFCTFQSLIMKFFYLFNLEYPDYQYLCFNAAVIQIALLSGFLEYKEDENPE